MMRCAVCACRKVGTVRTVHGRMYDRSTVDVKSNKCRGARTVTFLKTEREFQNFQTLDSIEEKIE